MDSKLIVFLKKLNDFVFIATILILMITQALLRKFFAFNSNPANAWFDLSFNFLLSICLFAFYLKKYNPDWIRKIFMALFFIELVAGITMKKFQIGYSNEIVFTGFIGILITWFNTHLNRKKFTEATE